MEKFNMGGAFGEMMMAAIGGVVCFVVIKEVMSGQNTTSWSYMTGLHIRVTDMVKGMNSVNPKSLRYGNTEPSVKACVETMSSPSNVDDDIVRACVKAQELPRNEVVALNKCGNRLQLWRLPSSRQSFRYWLLSVSSSLSSQFSSA